MHISPLLNVYIFIFECVLSLLNLCICSALMLEGQSHRTANLKQNDITLWLLFKLNLNNWRVGGASNFLIIPVHTAFPMHTVALSADKDFHLFVITTT